VQFAKKVARAILRRFRKPQPEQLGLPLRLDSLRQLEDWLSGAGLVKIKMTTVGFPPLTFMDRPIFGKQTSIRLNNWLQTLADRNVPGVRSSGMDYIILARKV
jgi:hypothetical protein